MVYTRRNIYDPPQFQYCQVYRQRVSVYARSRGEKRDVHIYMTVLSFCGFRQRDSTESEETRIIFQYPPKQTSVDSVQVTTWCSKPSSCRLEPMGPLYPRSCWRAERVTCIYSRPTSTRSSPRRRLQRRTDWWRAGRNTSISSPRGYFVSFLFTTPF